MHAPFRLASIRLTIATIFLTLTTSTLMAEPIGWMERFALSQDRQSVLAELIPGSEDYFYYHCLHYQTTGQLDQAEAILKSWLAEHNGQETLVIRGMLDRQRLLTYRESPQRTIDYLVSRLGVQLNHAPPAVKGERRYPVELAVEQLEVDRLVMEALHRNDPLKPSGMQHLAERFRKDETAGVPINLHEFLKRVDGAYIANLDELVIKELKSRQANNVRFGDLAAHQYLTLKELDRVTDAVPAVVDDNQLVDAKLARLRPSSDRDPSQQADVRLEYLKRVQAYMRTLPASYNSLKAASTYRLLEANLSQGEFDQALFMQYLQLPRTSPIVHPLRIRRMSDQAQLGDDFMTQALLPPVGNEEPLVRTYLEHFLRNAADTKPFDEFLQPEYLRRVFAETKLLAGVGDPEQWYRMLSATQRQTVRDSVGLRLAVENPTRVSTDDPTELRVDVKNIDDLVVRIYEINTLSYYRTHDQAIDTDIDLDGLVATHERSLKYNQPAVQRHREIIRLDEISGRGVWIVDFVGKGLRARALIRRGQLDHVDTESADGMVFTIIDEDRRPIAGATMLVGAQEFVADEKGRIVLPPVADQVTRKAMISDGEIATPIRFDHLRESYALSAAMHLDRTLVQSGGNAEILIRPQLKMAGQWIDPATMTDVSVRIEATDLDGIATTKTIDDVKPNQNEELVVPVRVPARLAQINVTLSGKIAGLADAKQQTLQTSHQWDIAGIRRTSHTFDAFLTRDGDDFVIEVRGRSGEPVSGATVNVSLDTIFCQTPVEQVLQSDDRGRIRLSALEGVATIRYGVASGVQHQRDLKLNRVIWPHQVHTASNQPIQLPLADLTTEVESKFRLVERRGGAIHADHSDQLSVDRGMLVIKPLPAGDYQLIDRKTATTTSIVSVDGREMDRVVVGEVRHRSVLPTSPLTIESIERDQNGLKIKLAGQTETARVHLYASRYLNETFPADALYLPLPGLSGRSISLPRCGYVSDLRLGDEYQYVLRRRFADKYPGVMLPQPGVILNPWETEETTNQSQTAEAGEVVPPSADEPASSSSLSREAQSKSEQSATSSDYDFLAEAGAMFVNLRADENGFVTLPADAIEGMPIIQVVVSDAATTMQRTLTSPLKEAETVDLRLAKSLEANRALSFERAVSIVSKENPLELSSLGSAQLQVYGDVGHLLKLYQTLINDPRLSEFEILGNWGQLDRDAKLKSYAQLASHELHLFLWSHDRGFFNEVVAPYLNNKNEKQFVDDWLLENDLTPYTKLWRYNQLNGAERALLAMRVPELRSAIQRELREIVADEQTNEDLVRRQIESALRTESLLAEEELEVLGQDRLSLGGVARSHDMYDNKNFDSDFAKESDALALGVPARQMNRRLAELKDELSRKNAAGKPILSKAFLGRSAGAVGGGAFGFYRDLDSTKQWAESHWDRVRVVGGPDPASLIPIDGFWADLSMCDRNNISGSTKVLRPVGNRHAALVALAMCGLPLEAGEIGLPSEPKEPYAPAHPVVVVTKRLQTLEPSDEETSILIGQRFAPLNVRTDDDDAVVEPKEFLAGEAYQGQTVLSNPTAQRRVVDVFWQLPAGSVPLGGSQVTDSQTITLEPFAVHAIAYQFYFPKPGSFVHYPATVAADGKLIARGNEKEFRVVESPSEDDSITWEKLVRTGTAEQLADFLKDANLRSINWMLVAHRMQDQEVYQAIIKTLGDANVAVAELWAYSLKHRDEPAMSQYLSLRHDLVDRVGPVLRSPLLDVDPIDRRKHELLEYAPLVLARIHPLTDENEILNPTFLNQYREFVRTLAFSASKSEDEALVLSYYLLIQNRISEAIQTFARVDAKAVTAKLQYDYMAAYQAMHRGQFDEAESLARKYAGHPIPRWQARFAELSRQLQQRRDLSAPEQLVTVGKANEGASIAEGATIAEGVSIAEGSGDLAVLDRERRQQNASSEQPEVVVRVEGNSLRIDHRRAKEVTMNLYGVDLELLFSKAPFVREDLQRMAMVKPMQTDTITFDDESGIGRYELNENLQRQTLLVEVVAGASRSTALFYGGQITTYVSESFGQLQTTNATTHQPISTAYVKVYAKYPDGDVRFYKDGYTDARGRFDYASVSAADAKGAERFAILVMSEEQGATLHDVAPPNR